MTPKNIKIKEYVLNRDQGICQRCGKYCWDMGEIAHRIADTKVNKKIYNTTIIDHAFNKVWVCKDKNCNDSFNIGNSPNKCKNLVNLIYDYFHDNVSVQIINETINE